MRCIARNIFCVDFFIQAKLLCHPTFAKAHRSPCLTNFPFHRGCVTEKVLQNLKETYESINDLPGFNDLNSQDQERVQKAWTEGHMSETEMEGKNLAGVDRCALIVHWESVLCLLCA